MNFLNAVNDKIKNAKKSNVSLMSPSAVESNEDQTERWFKEIESNSNFFSLVKISIG